MSKSIISDRRLQFIAELIKELNKILGIKTKLLMAFHLQIDRHGPSGRISKIDNIVLENSLSSLVINLI